MRTPRQIAAARANGAKSRGPKTPEGKLAAAANSAKSTGPTTPEGKARSARNSTRHTLLADSMVLRGESDTRFCAFLTDLEEELQPKTGVESTQIEVMAVAHWRRMRLWSIEKALYIGEGFRRNSSAMNFGAAANDANPNGDSPIAQITQSFRSMADESRAMELLNRYETRYGREYLRALACFNNHRTRNNAQPGDGCEQASPNLAQIVARSDSGPARSEPEPKRSEPRAERTEPRPEPTGLKPAA